MQSTWKDHRSAWFVVGLLAGLTIAYVWPHEPALAVGADSNSEFALCTTSVELLNPMEAVFVLDQFTGQVFGACLNRQTGKFTHFFVRNVAIDMRIPEGSQPKFAMVPGLISVVAASPIPPGNSALYIAEANSGIVAAYGFVYRESQIPPGPVPLQLIDSFQFKKRADN
jgi:hypothetical protein